MLTFSLPIYWTKQFKTKPDKTILVGMNWYRNAHHFDQNSLKQQYQILIASLVNTTKSYSSYEINYKLYYKNPNCDASNIIALIEKVTLDALQFMGILVQDSVKYHIRSSWEVAGQDKQNPRCEITVKDYNDPAN